MFLWEKRVGTTDYGDSEWVEQSGKVLFLVWIIRYHLL